MSGGRRRSLIAALLLSSGLTSCSGTDGATTVAPDGNGIVFNAFGANQRVQINSNRVALSANDGIVLNADGAAARGQAVRSSAGRRRSARPTARASCRRSTKLSCD